MPQPPAALGLLVLALPLLLGVMMPAKTLDSIYRGE